MLIDFLVYPFGILACVALAVFVLDRSLRAKGYSGPVSDHFDGTRFFNLKDPKSIREERSFWEFLRWILFREKSVWEVRAVQQVRPAVRVMGREIVATMINHATVLIQTEDLNIITDPVYAERASPFSFLGPKRFAAPGVAFGDLPAINVILLSHNHYDHMDLAALKRLVERDAPAIYVSLGNKAFLQKHGIAGATELDWWQSHEAADGITINCVAAQHFPARALSDRNKTLWCGYVIGTPNGDIYFAGDTGWGPFVDRIAEKFPDGFRFGILPIGAYRPERLMREVHVSPDEAHAIRDRLKIADTFAIHFGTFKLADDSQDEPANRMRELAEGTTASGRFEVLPNGGSMRVDSVRSH